MGNDLRLLLEDGENQEVEFKSSKGGLPKSLWETYSAFANTNGGIIVLGIAEKGDRLSIVDINPNALLKDFWSTINNPQKISRNILKDDDVNIIEYENKQLIKIHVRRAYRDEKPIYIEQNPLIGSYKRNYEGDYKCTEREVKAMLADQADETQDRKILEGFTIDDLDIDSINSYRSRLAALKPNHPFLAKDIQAFLNEVGAWGKSRSSKLEGITAAGLLMFGKERSIVDEFPNYFLDYREYSKDILQSRWLHRIISNDGTWTGNVYEFFFKVINRLTEDLNIPFHTVDLLRREDTNVHIALREALANTLLHTDFYGERGIVIEKHSTSITFSNPGSMRVSIPQAVQGGISDPRNSNLFKMFTLIGLGERAGSGIPVIVQAWQEQHWRFPEITEEVQPDRTILKLLTMSLLPNESIQFFKTCLKERYHMLNKEHILALVTAHQEQSVSNARLQILLEQHPQELNKLLNFLVDQGFLISQGKGRWTRYVLSDFFNVAFSDDKEEQKQHSTSWKQHKDHLEQHSEPWKQHKDTSNLLNEQPLTDDDPTEMQLQQIAQRVNKGKRTNVIAMNQVILELCAIKAMDMKTLAAMLNRNEASLYNHYIMRLVRERKLKKMYKKDIASWVYVNEENNLE
ncbi:RNA-binding domain-containing protein [Paenibacillus sp. WLX1005]|uniref:RNA-binding domain-containing protein n=1 Tax=Paenibacillus sp. WLX1005 TaxID=3243766 RepID=UPI003983FB8A